MFNLILLSALMGPCPDGQCTVDSLGTPLVTVETTAEHPTARKPVRTAVRIVVDRKPVRTRLTQLRERKPVRRGLARLVRRCRR